MKFGQIIEYNKKYIFLQKATENEPRRLVPELFLFFLYKIKASVLQLSFKILKSTKIENPTYPCKTALSVANVNAS